MHRAVNCHESLRGVVGNAQAAFGAATPEHKASSGLPPPNSKQRRRHANGQILPFGGMASVADDGLPTIATIFYGKLNSRSLRWSMYYFGEILNPKTRLCSGLTAPRSRCFLFVAFVISYGHTREQNGYPAQWVVLFTDLQSAGISISVNRSRSGSWRVRGCHPRTQGQFGAATPELGDLTPEPRKCGRRRAGTNSERTQVTFGWVAWVLRAFGRVFRPVAVLACKEPIHETNTTQAPGPKPWALGPGPWAMGPRVGLAVA